MVSREHINDLVACIVAEFRPQRVVLFGSHAAGTAGADSDVDLLVVLPVEGQRHRLAARIRARLPHTIPIDIVVRSSHDIADGKFMGDPITMEAFRSGVTMYLAAA